MGALPPITVSQEALDAAKTNWWEVATEVANPDPNKLRPLPEFMDEVRARIAAYER